MNEEPEEEWKEEDLPEGFDVYDYDARRARAGQILVLCIFGLFFLMLIIATYHSYRDFRQWQLDHPHEVQSSR